MKHEIAFSISIDFMKAYGVLPHAQQKKVGDFVRLFQSDPTSSGINYEKIHDAQDPSLRSVRIDQIYRAIIFQAQRSNVYILLWVDRHEQAYEWARRRRLSIHPQTGALQLVQFVEQTVVKQKEVLPGMYDDFSDAQLLQLGVPEVMLTQVRAIQSEEDLEKIKELLPVEAYTGLFYLSCDSPFDEVLAELYPDSSATVDTTDFWAALNKDDSKSRFTIIEDSLALQELLNAPLSQWRVFLHPLQRKMVQMSARGPIKVIGSAGTGKTVVAIHRAKWLLQNVFNKSSDRILFTTFTKNLANDIREYLSMICSSDDMKRIDIVNLDKWTSTFLTRNKYSGIVDFENKQTKELWREALKLAPADVDFSDQFYKDEWDQVIQPQDVFSLEQYFKANRIGRGRRLDRKTRKSIWIVFEEYRALLIENNVKEIEDAYRDAKMILKEGHASTPYKAVIVDEVQDLNHHALSMIRAIVPEGDNDLFLVGDPHQRIYGFQNSLADAGIKVQGRSKKLKINYRTTEETRHYATMVLKGMAYDDLNGEPDSLDDCKSLTNGPDTTVLYFDTFEQQSQALVQLVRNLHDSNVSYSDICVTYRLNDAGKQYQSILLDNGIPCYVITGEKSKYSEKELNLATMHRIKGIEFDFVILVSASNDTLPLKSQLDKQDNPTDRELFIQKERSLLYVALTRARKQVYILGYGTHSPLIPEM